MRPIYLDYAATTPVDPRVALKMQTCLMEEGAFGNAHSLHAYGKEAKALIEAARLEVASSIHAEPSEIIWTSGATESINLAIKGVAHLYKRRGKHIVTMQTEHKATLDVCQQLEKEGYQVTYLSPERNGVLDIEKLKLALKFDTLLISVMHVNNETGVIQDLQSIANLVGERRILLHVDAAQSMGKVNLDVRQTPIDLLSLSAHKACGPKGMGALYLRKRPRIRVQPLIHGGGHEHGMRSGTLSTHQIVGMGEAFRIAREERERDFQHAICLRDQLLHGLRAIREIVLHTDLEKSVPHIVNIGFPNQLADAILTACPMLAASTASACQGSNMDGSHVLRAMGLTQAEAKSAIRFSFGRFTSMDEINQAVRMLAV